MKIVVGSRESKLAVIQSEIVMKAINEFHPEIDLELLTMKTTGDKILNKTLDKIGGKGLFVKELDKALLDGRADITVHSLKDMPMDVDPRIPLIAFSKREDPRDVLILPKGIDEIDYSKPIGCSSKRRTLHLEKLYPNAKVKSIRGNVQTRLAKLDGGEYSAIVLAYAGLKRLGLEDRASRIFTTEEMVPAVCQGILAVQAREGFRSEFLAEFDNEEARSVAMAERSFVRTLDGGCSSPIAAYAVIDGDNMRLTGFYADESGNQLTETATGDKNSGERLGRDLALSMKKKLLCNMGTVYLVGAGPGDKGLLTLNALDTIQNSDVIVHDRLVSEEIMALIPETTELIDVGKNVGEHKVPQERINEMLVEQAMMGKTVCRLKGGDPFLFGRGGEELELLVKHHVPFRVIPGISSSIAAPTYGGIPVTHRDFCSSVHIITGHGKRGSKPKIDFDALVRLNGTLIFMMSVGNVQYIANGLMEAQMDENMPCAIIENGTRYNQRKIISTLSNVVDDVRENAIVSPAIIMVGRVCQLGYDFDWFSQLPLKGLRVLVTQPAVKNSHLADGIRNLGGKPILYPVIETVPLPNLHSSWQEADVLVFTSAFGISTFIEHLKSNGKDARALHGKRIAVVGPKTGVAFESFGIEADFIPSVYDGAHLGQEMIDSGFLKKDEQVVLIRAEKGSADIISIFKENDINFVDCPAYRTEFISHNRLNLDEIDWITFTSKSCVEGLIATQKNTDFNGFPALCIGHQTEAAAKAHGFDAVVSNIATVDNMIEKLIEEAVKRHE